MNRVATAPRAEESLAAMAKALYARGWMEGTAGNLSVRLDDGRALITASGLSKGELTPDDMVLVEAETGSPLTPDGRRPSAETCIHAALYRVFPGCGAVVHAHCPYGTAVSAGAGGNSVRFTGFEIIKGLGLADPSQVEVPVFANWADVPRIAHEVAERYAAPGPGTPPVFLIEHHGATAWGPTLEAARNRLECLEALCRLHLITPRSSEEPR
ncbi:methylthioribulose 1-phosphate dehydratase [Nonomuraea sp. MG754425]|uniref:methylthioribulose 1-phosphate dehydratase n=1 Tax=Nonomuraea sp. MG754425 TaxID=2570319 RepID=UPI001F02EE19|nr:methylthioribulose 1-phosphate dehydratase [Nonomuraea sp. MG754425]MCF6469984.1 methylthioribulose 1-phosphate dehydratase [Nonomuraea sp. MG754425]